MEYQEIINKLNQAIKEATEFGNQLKQAINNGEDNAVIKKINDSLFFRFMTINSLIHTLGMKYGDLPDTIDRYLGDV